MRPQVWPAWEAFHGASLAREQDMHNPAKAAALVAARTQLDEALAAVLARVPYRARKVADLRPTRGGGSVHLAVTKEIVLQGWQGRREQTLCGTASGRYAGERPVTCKTCLRMLDRHVDLEADPPELPLF